MKKINIKKSVFAVVILIMTLGLFVSCNNDDTDASSKEVVLLSFGPSGSIHGDMISFIGHNLDRVTSVKLEGVEVLKADFLVQTADRIEFKIPEETREGLITLVYDGGEVVSKTIFSLDVPFVIESLPATVKPGENMTIKGKHLDWIKSIVFADGIIVTEFVSASLNELVVKVPTNTITGSLTIMGKGTKPYSFLSETNIIATLPVITAISPVAVNRGDILTLTGTDLDLVKSIKFPGSTAVLAFESKTATTITIKVPADAVSGSLKITSFSGIVKETAASVTIIGVSNELPLKSVIFDDALKNGFKNYSWKVTSTIITSEVKEGTSALKIEYTGDGGMKLFSDTFLSATGMTELVFSIYGGEGLGNSSKLGLMVNNKYGILFVQAEVGKWKEIVIPLSEIASKGVDLTNGVQEIALQNTAGYFIIDKVGLR